MNKQVEIHGLSQESLDKIAKVIDFNPADYEVGTLIEKYVRNHFEYRPMTYDAVNKTYVQSKAASSEADVRAVLREGLMIGALLDSNNELKFSAEFSGYGDSANVDAATGLAAMDMFLTGMVNRHANWDWYNNDGGGGDIEWAVKEDEIKISGHYNETVQQDVDEVTV
jgi:hypothetical protein